MSNVVAGLTVVETDTLHECALPFERHDHLCEVPGESLKRNTPMIGPRFDDAVIVALRLQCGAVSSQ